MARETRLAIAKPGDVVFIECTNAMTEMRWKKILEETKESFAETGVKAVLLYHGLRVARIDEPEDVPRSTRRIGFIQPQE